MKLPRDNLAGMLLLGTLLSRTTSLAAASDPSAVEEFKKFLSTPPSVESVVFSERQSPDPQDLRLTNSSLSHYEGRFQGDAFLLRELLSPDSVSVLKMNGLLAADDGIVSWFHYGQNRIIDSASGSSNEIRRSTYLVWHGLRQVLTLGIMRSVPGSAEWRGNAFRVRQTDAGVSAWGNLNVSQGGVVDSLNVTYRLDSGDVHWRILYGYEGAKTTWLPSEIRCLLVDGSAEKEIIKFLIWQLRLSPEPMTRREFDPTQMVAQNGWATLMHTNHYIYLLARDGRSKNVEIARQVLSPDEGAKHLAEVPPTVYALWAGANASIFILVVRMKKKLNQIKNCKTERTL